ncbi:MAG: dihydroneopterin aldolase [Muribaculaceae bacterium]|nr:dihydroneopterin aldolase [Muribaculaceae bacterium]
MELEISLDNLRFNAFHGVLEFENSFGNEFIVNLLVRIPWNPSIEEDNLDNTISYASLYEIVKEEMEVPRKLLEKVAAQIVRRIKEQYSDISSGYVKIEKVHPPIPGILGSASVRLLF